MDYKIVDLLKETVKRKASDLHISVGKPPIFRVDDVLLPISNEAPALTKEQAEKLTLGLLTEQQKEKISQEREIDFAYSLEDKHRFRVNAYFQQDTHAAALRLIPGEVKTFAELGLPEILVEFAKSQQGLFLAVGPAGHGKSTSIASMIDWINHSRTDHVITIEDPIEYVFKQDKCSIDQREVARDTVSFTKALRSSLRQDPDVVFVGELRDLETISTALTLSETGHLVISTLHTNNAAQTIDRLIDVFPAHQQGQVRSQVASSLLGIVSQRLLPKIGGGRIVAAEILKVIPSVRNIIREGKVYQMENVIQTNMGEGMIPLDTSLAKLVKEKKVEKNNALAHVIDGKNFEVAFNQ
ncbi:MAG: PilT/PilU family type 4a pilus ATPase [Parcubacteria group bacterium]